MKLKAIQMRRIAFLTFLLVVPAIGSGQGMPDIETDLDSLMAQVSMTSRDIRFDQRQMSAWQGDLWKLDRFSLLHESPLLLPAYGQLLQTSLSEQQFDLSKLTATASQWLDYPVRRGLIGDPLLPYYANKDSLPKVTITKGKNILVGEQFAKLRQRINLIYNVAEDKSLLLSRALRDVDGKGTRQRLINYLLAEEDPVDRPKPRAKVTLLDNLRSNVSDQRSEGVWVEELVAKVDWNWLYAGAQDVAELADRLADSVEFLAMPQTRVDVESEAGRIVIGTSGDDTYDYFVPPLVIIDGGGNDTYSFGDVGSRSSFSIIIDAAGDDLYRSTDSSECGIGAGIMSMSILIDKSGNDRYEGNDFAFGSGLFGVGIVHDYAGNDTYTSKRYSQGSGVFGVGMLIDNQGTDSYDCWGMSQGFGYSKGFGLLLDADGDDQYSAEDSLLFSPASQTKEHNSSLAQGAGFGKRADYIDGHSWAGGVGALVDLAGNDSYACGVFGQGCSYWYSIGFLLDASGNDRYNGVWYVQGAGAHFGASLLADGDGNDQYTASMNMAQGAGHDFTIGILSDAAGDDIYTAPNLSLGAGNANGIGLLLEFAGNDRYQTKGGTVLGRANGEIAGVRGMLITMGLFLDRAGEDIYSESHAANSSRWRGPRSNEKGNPKLEIGLGLDK